MIEQHKVTITRQTDLIARHESVCQSHESTIHDLEERLEELWAQQEEYESDMREKNQVCCWALHTVSQLLRLTGIALVPCCLLMHFGSLIQGQSLSSGSIGAVVYLYCIEQ